MVGVACAATGCTAPDELEYSERESEASVGSYVASSCSTSTVVGLSKQIAEEIGCMNPDSMVSFTPGGNLRFSSNAVLPYLSAAGKADLLKVAQNTVIQVNSGFRTVAQQYLLYRWYRTGRCGIPVAATPGTSNHESGRALDLQNYNQVINQMAAQNWSHPIPNDPVHFEHRSSPDIRGRDVLAFQRLWNRNNPGDRIAEDGDYGPATEARLAQAPAEGFPTGADCTTGTRAIDVVSVDGPDKIAPGTTHVYRISLKNTGKVAWPASTRILTAGAVESPLFDADTWVSPTDAGTLGVVIEPGKSGSWSLTVDAPQVMSTQAVATQFKLVDGEAKSEVIDLAVTVTLDGDEDTSGDADDEHDHSEVVGGACNAGAGGSGGFAVIALAGLAIVRRRRRS